MIESVRMADNPGVDREKPKSLKEIVKADVAKLFLAALNTGQKKQQSFLGEERTLDDGRIASTSVLVWWSDKRVDELKKLTPENFLDEATNLDMFTLGIRDPNKPADYNAVEVYEYGFEPPNLRTAKHREMRSTYEGRSENLDTEKEGLRAFKTAIDLFNKAGVLPQSTN